MTKQPTYKALYDLVKQQAVIMERQAKSIQRLSKEIVLLKAEIQLLKHPKNSRNSSIAPSQDQNQPNQSLRKPSGKKPGGQKGRKDKTLEMTTHPDVTVKLYPDFCRLFG